MVMCKGDVVESGTSKEIFENPKSEYTRELIAAAFNLKAK
jgi:microcin C transport system ATP-binding protein